MMPTLFEQHDELQQQHREKAKLRAAVERALMETMPSMVTAIVDRLTGETAIGPFDRPYSLALYSRRSGGDVARRRQQIERYRRQAEDSAAQKNFKKPGSTTFEAEFKALCKRNGVAA